MKMRRGPYDKVIIRWVFYRFGKSIIIINGLHVNCFRMPVIFPKCSKRNSNEFCVNNLGLCREIILLRRLPLSLVKARL